MLLDGFSQFIYQPLSHLLQPRIFCSCALKAAAMTTSSPLRRSTRLVVQQVTTKTMQSVAPETAEVKGERRRVASKAVSYKIEEVDDVEERTGAPETGTEQKRWPKQENNKNGQEDKPLKRRRKRAEAVDAIDGDEVKMPDDDLKTKRQKHRNKGISDDKDMVASGEPTEAEKEKPAKRRVTKAKSTANEEDEKSIKKPKKPKVEKTIEIPDMDTEYMWARAKACKKYVGAHVSAAGGSHNAVITSTKIGGTCFALFVKNQRRWESPPTPGSQVEAFAKACPLAGFCPKTHVLPHGSYLVNLANYEDERATQAFNGFVDELKRCEELGIGLYNFQLSIVEAVHEQHLSMRGTIFLIALSGYDIRTQETYNATLTSFDRIVGLKYLRAMHINDSKCPLGSKKDRHENLGKGEIGLEAFRCIMNDERMNGIPLVLETPERDGDMGYKEEIDILYGLVESK
ncbi:apurinic endonuclease (APN1) [Spizellomyces punctatus DAOM BR117]|uniref:Apurinic endonuclease (APN1) n=1 Tax=Spizellomyces punctatus (strain DAOM BR117) TaxID=645134 RepID=A0A0L0H7T4_SPIPD|nr:apurinic endonuclease (APN1) [Spizellomyces punctatus DAOM BR117]KNC96981.1 apurinic endonuclease (APN1) [Spizellomyces punctatus DAOM BR117]|eukprot:XP_016605021.1 apurinic endonuclease (APN1) [Spizellomyces punctatus DAOM BR117]